MGTRKPVVKVNWQPTRLEATSRGLLLYVERLWTAHGHQWFWAVDGRAMAKHGYEDTLAAAVRQAERRALAMENARRSRRRP